MKPRGLHLEDGGGDGGAGNGSPRAPVSAAAQPRARWMDEDPEWNDIEGEWRDEKGLPDRVRVEREQGGLARRPPVLGPRILHRRTQAVLDFMVEFQERFDYLPSVREIQEGLGLSSTSVVDYHKQKLIRWGYLRPIVARDYELPPEFVRVERSYSGGRVDVSYECPYCTRTEPEGHQHDCPRQLANDAMRAVLEVPA